MSYCEDLCANSLKLIFEDGVEIHRNFRPDWLKNPKTGKNLELDFYIPYVQVAIEIQGSHHYDDLNQRENDDLKRRLCLSNKVTLIEVSIFQIKPSLIRRKIINYIGNCGKLTRIKIYDKEWECLPEIAEYKKKILTKYPNSKCVKSPRFNFDEEKRKNFYSKLDNEIFTRIEYVYSTPRGSCRVTPVEIISRKNVKCRILGSDKFIFIKKKFFANVLGV